MSTLTVVLAAGCGSETPAGPEPEAESLAPACDSIEATVAELIAVPDLEYRSQPVDGDEATPDSGCAVHSATLDHTYRGRRPSVRHTFGE